jgi:hypothetical protein
MRRISAYVCGLALAAALILALHGIAGATKVDCDKVMAALAAGNKPKAVALELDISVSSVHRCRSKAKQAASAPAAPAAKPSPAAAALKPPTASAAPSAAKAAPQAKK